MIDYKNKYLKYKNKYLQLKNQIGGTNVVVDFSNFKDKNFVKYNNNFRLCSLKKSGDILKRHFKFYKISGDNYDEITKEDYENNTYKKYVCEYPYFLNLEIGQYNPGALCYSNSFVQILSFTYPISYSILKNQDKFLSEFEKKKTKINSLLDIELTIKDLEMRKKRKETIFLNNLKNGIDNSQIEPQLEQLKNLLKDANNEIIKLVSNNLENVKIEDNLISELKSELEALKAKISNLNEEEEIQKNNQEIKEKKEEIKARILGRKIELKKDYFKSLRAKYEFITFLNEKQKNVKSNQGIYNYSEKVCKLMSNYYVREQQDSSELISTFLNYLDINDKLKMNLITANTVKRNGNEIFSRDTFEDTTNLSLEINSKGMNFSTLEQVIENFGREEEIEYNFFDDINHVEKINLQKFEVVTKMKLQELLKKSISDIEIINPEYINYIKRNYGGYDVNTFNEYDIDYVKREFNIDDLSNFIKTNFEVRWGGKDLNYGEIVIKLISYNNTIQEARQAVEEAIQAEQEERLKEAEKEKERFIEYLQINKSLINKIYRITTKMSFTNPKILVIHLKRFDSSNNKLNHPVEMPFKKKIGNDTYDLYGINYHMGGTIGGHYYSFVRQPEFNHKELNKLKEGWYIADDTNFQRVNIMEQSERNTGYIYFYLKRTEGGEYPHKLSNDNNIMFRYE
jgi:hypothetical protein